MLHAVQQLSCLFIGLDPVTEFQSMSAQRPWSGGVFSSVLMPHKSAVQESFYKSW